MAPYSDALTAIVRDGVELIRETRRHRRLTKYALAKAAGVSHQIPANVEALPKDPGLTMIIRL
jgi:DNA-binding XRE family transcriptional regulator